MVQVFYRRAHNSDTHEGQLVQLSTDEQRNVADGWLPVDVGGGGSALPDTDAVVGMTDGMCEVDNQFPLVPYIEPVELPAVAVQGQSKKEWATVGLFPRRGIEHDPETLRVAARRGLESEDGKTGTPVNSGKHAVIASCNRCDPILQLPVAVLLA